MTSTLSTEAGTAILTQVVLGGLVDPFPLYGELRELDEGVHWCAELQGWVATRAADIRAIGEDPATYSNEMGASSGATAHDPADPVQRRYGEVANNFLIYLDPPRHTQVRAVFRHAFTPRALTVYQETMERIADDLLAEYSSGDEVDFMDKLAAKIPIEVIATILGLPRSDFALFAEWTDAVALAIDPGVQGDPRVGAIYKTVEFLDYLEEVAADRRKEPQDDLISLIVNTPVEGDEPLETGVAVAQAMLLLAAGNDTTTNLLGNAITILLDRPELQQRLVADPSLIPQAVEEVLRFDPPFHFDYRKATRDHMLGGREIKAGTPIFLLLAAANRDPRVFPDPGTFDLDRENKRHLSFSHGIHRCVGAPLARMEGVVGLAKILGRFPHLTHGSTPPEPKVTNFVTRGWDKRPVTLLDSRDPS
jgi:cytochrome P450